MAPRPKGAIRKARALPSKQRSPWQKKILAARRTNVARRNTARRSSAQQASLAKATAASAARRRGGGRVGPKPGTRAALAGSRRYQTLRSRGTVSSVGQYKKRLGTARYMSKAQFKAARPKGSYKKYTRYVARRTGQTIGQVRRKQVGRPISRPAPRRPKPKAPSFRKYVGGPRTGRR